MDGTILFFNLHLNSFFSKILNLSSVSIIEPSSTWSVFTRDPELS